MIGRFLFGAQGPYRTLYHGEITWNRTRKRNAWGQVAAQPLPQLNWFTVPAPQLRIVSDDLWHRDSTLRHCPRTIPIAESADNLYYASCQIVHRANDFDASLLFQGFQDWTAAADLGDTQSDIRSRHSIHVSRILARSLAVKLRCQDRWLDPREQSSQIAQDDIVDSSFHRPARGMPENQHKLCAGRCTAKLHAAQHVVVHDVSRNASNENISDACIEDDFGWDSGIKASEYDRRWILPRRARSLLRSIIPRSHLPGPESLIPLLQFVNNLRRGHAVTFVFCQRPTHIGRELHR
jgi:hypothetical protein